MLNWDRNAEKRRAFSHVGRYNGIEQYRSKRRTKYDAKLYVMLCTTLIRTFLFYVAHLLICCFLPFFFNKRKRQPQRPSAALSPSRQWTYCALLFSSLFFFFSPFVCMPRVTALQSTCKWKIENFCHSVHRLNATDSVRREKRSCRKVPKESADGRQNTTRETRSSNNGNKTGVARVPNTGLQDLRNLQKPKSCYTSMNFYVLTGLFIKSAPSKSWCRIESEKNLRASS